MQVFKVLQHMCKNPFQKTLSDYVVFRIMQVRIMQVPLHIYFSEATCVQLMEFEACQVKKLTI